jgi:quercetin dioxygenase-like cupin family protein
MEQVITRRHGGVCTMRSIHVPQSEAIPAQRTESYRSWWFLDTLVIEYRSDDPTVLEIVVPPGGAPPEHVHAHYDDSFLLLDGDLVMCRAGERVLARPGDWICTPAGTPHAFRVVGDRPARMLSVFNSRSFLDLIQVLGEPAQHAGLPPLGRSPVAERVSNAFSSHDVQVVGDSLDAREAASFFEVQAGSVSEARR